MLKLIKFSILLYMFTTTYALLVLTPIVYNSKENGISTICINQLNKYNSMANDCKNDKCKDIFTESFVEDVRTNCQENDIEKKLFEQIESTYLFNSISNLEVDGVNCSLYSVNLGQSIESRCKCMRKTIEYLENYTKEHDNSILTDSIAEFKSEIDEACL